MQNIRVLFQKFQSVHGYSALLPIKICNKTQSFDWASLYQVSLDNMAEKEGFEPSRQLPHPTPLAGEPLRPLGYFSTAYKNMKLAEREGFDPPVPFDITGFQDQRLQPLGHLSLLEPATNIIPDRSGFVNRKFLRATEINVGLQ